MSKRFFTKINNKGRLIIIDKECHIELIDLTIACDVLNRLDLKLKHYNEVNGEQQATITHLEKVFGENFAKRRLLEQDNLVLRNENKNLKEENASLKQRIRDIKYNNCD